MTKRPTKQDPELHSWAVYHLRGTPAKLVGFVYNQPDGLSAIKAFAQIGPRSNISLATAVAI
jgi:hypothetical protein